MNYLIEWDENLIKVLDRSFSHSSYGPISPEGLGVHMHRWDFKYLYIKGAYQREDLFAKGWSHYSPPMIKVEGLNRGDKSYFKKSYNKNLFVLSKSTPIEVFKDIINAESTDRENALVPDSCKNYLVKLNFDNILKSCN